MHNSAEHEISPANKSQITNNCNFFLSKHVEEHEKSFITSGPDPKSRISLESSLFQIHIAQF